MEIPISLPGLLLAHLCAVFCQGETEWLFMGDVCEAQCGVFCSEYQDSCGAGCLRPIRDVWGRLCQNKESCADKCIEMGKIIFNENYVCRIPEVKLYTHNNQIILRWDRDPSCENLAVIYVIQGQTPGGEWLMLDWVEKNKYVALESEFCDNFRFRVAAVTQYGTLGFSNTKYLIPSPKLSFHPPKPTYNSSKKEFYTNIVCEDPQGFINSSQAYCEWDPKFTVNCENDDMNRVQPILRQFNGSLPMRFQIGIATAGFGCSYKGRVRLISGCGAHGDWTDVVLTVTECSQMNGFRCKENVTPPGVVSVVTVKHDGKGIQVKWDPPKETGSRGIAGYGLQWGICHPFRGFNNLFTLNPKQMIFVSKPEFTLPVVDSGSSRQYGAKVVALGPGQDLNSVNFPVMTAHCMMKQPGGSTENSQNHGHGKGHVVLDEKGVKIVHYPHTPRLMVSWLLSYRDRERNHVKQYALRWGPLSGQGDVRLSPESFALEDRWFEVENSTLVPGNSTEVNITVKEPSREYGLQLCQLLSPVEDDDDVEWNKTDDFHFSLSSGYQTVGNVPSGVTHSSELSTVATNPSELPSIAVAAPEDQSTKPGSKPTLVYNVISDKMSTHFVGKVTHSQSNQNSMVVYIVVPCSAVLLIAVTLAVTIHRKRKQPRLEQSMRRENRVDDDRYNIIRFTHGSAQFTVSDNTAITPVPDKWEIPRACLESGPILGTGAFGQVVKGRVSKNVLSFEISQSVVRDIDQSPDTHSSSDMITVAIKMLQDGIEETYRQDFLKEIKLMKGIGCHGNIVSMLGCCTLDDPVCLVVEHVPNGDLLSYLRDVRVQYRQSQSCINEYTNMRPVELTWVDLLSFARQIAVGMEFLSQKGYVHRDLAARNVLVGEHKTLKIGDFGLARYVYDDKVYLNRRGGKLPIKWMSIEAIFDLTFSTASDVWSFGIVLFEICTLGGTPYPTLDNTELLTELRRGWRMPCPDGCSPQLYQLMLECWKEAPSDRPSFSSFRQSLESMMEQTSSANYIHLPQTNNTGTNITPPSHADLEKDEPLHGDKIQETSNEFDSNLMTVSELDTSSSITGTSSETTGSSEPDLADGSQAVMCDSDSSVGTRDVDDDVFDSASICGCNPPHSPSAFSFGESCSKCGKLKGPFQDKLSRFGALICHAGDGADQMSSSTGEFLLRSDCIRSDRIESDVSTSTCSSGEFLIHQELSFNERPHSRDSETSISSSTCLLSSPKSLEMSVPSPPPIESLQETRL